MSDAEITDKSSPPIKLKNKFLEKLKSIKHIEIIIAAVFALIMILIYMSTLSISGNKLKASDSTVEGYLHRTEEKLEYVLQNIKGTSNVSIIITLDMTGFAVDEKTQIVKMDKFPPIKGVVIVAKGVDDMGVKLNILKATQALFGLPTANVEIFLSK